MLTAVLFLINQNLQHPKCPASSERVNKLCYMLYSFSGILSHKMKENTDKYTALTSLKIIMLREKPNTKNIYYMIQLIRNSSKNK